MQEHIGNLVSVLGKAEAAVFINNIEDIYGKTIAHKAGLADRGELLGAMDNLGADLTKTDHLKAKPSEYLDETEVPMKNQPVDDIQKQLAQAVSSLALTEGSPPDDSSMIPHKEKLATDQQLPRNS